jgi:hypothetical protein
LPRKGDIGIVKIGQKIEDFEFEANCKLRFLSAGMKARSARPIGDRGGKPSDRIWISSAGSKVAYPEVPGD